MGCLWSPLKLHSRAMLVHSQLLCFWLVRILRILFHVVMIMLTTTKLDTLLFYYYVTSIKSIYIFISFTDAYSVVKSQKYIKKFDRRSFWGQEERLIIYRAAAFNTFPEGVDTPGRYSRFQVTGMIEGLYFSGRKIWQVPFWGGLI